MLKPSFFTFFVAKFFFFFKKKCHVFEIVQGPKILSRPHTQLIDDFQKFSTSLFFMFSSFHRWWWNFFPAQSHVFSTFFIDRNCHRCRHFFIFTTDNESKKMLKTSSSPKSPKPQKSIIQKRSILTLFRLPYIGQYVRFSAMELKWSFLRGPAHKIEKRPFFAKKREVEEKQKGFEVSTCLQ